MKAWFKLKRLLFSLGLDVSRARGGVLGNQPHRDIDALLAGTIRPMVFDVGANIGQSIHRFKAQIPDAIIHSFEPDPRLTEQLELAASQYSDTFVHPMALGAARCELELQQSAASDWNSLLPSGELGPRMVARTRVPVETLDGFCEEAGIERISALKLDTQGYDLEALRGGDGLLKRGAIDLVLTEVLFDDLYQNAPRFEEILTFMRERRYRVSCIYRGSHRDGFLSWTDVLFRFEGAGAGRP